MQVSAARYTDDQNTIAATIDDREWFGIIERSRFWPAVMAWQAAGNTITPYVAPTPSTNPADYRLTKRQISAALILSGTSTDPNGFITGVIGAITDPTAKALAMNDWQNAPYYARDNQLFNEPNLLASANLTSAQVDALWLLAKDQPA